MPDPKKKNISVYRTEKKEQKNLSDCPQAQSCEPTFKYLRKTIKALLQSGMQMTEELNMGREMLAVLTNEM